MIQKSNSTVTVNTSFLKNNLDTLSCYLDPETKIMAVVKADAYGHGSVKVAEALEQKVDAFAVNAIQEGVELREGGITKPILVFEVPQETLILQYKKHDLTATISAKEHFEWITDGTSYHLNFNTGMARMGFNADEAQEIADLVKARPEIFCKGIYTHFATANDPGSDFVKKQHNIFKEVCRYFPDHLTTHIANTGGTVHYENEQFDMVRLGIGLYGYPSGDIAVEGLKPALNWHSSLVQINKIKEGESVSYGATWRAPADGYVGILPVGYEDGVKRRLSDRLRVRIREQEYNVVGTVTMNYTFVYLGKENYPQGTRVDLLYKGNDAYHWTKQLNTIPYEALTSIDKRIPRAYIES